MICISCQIDKPTSKFGSRDNGRWIDKRCNSCVHSARKAGADTYIDEMGVEDVMLGIPHALTKYEWMEVARRFKARGVSARSAAIKVGLNERTMQRYYKRLERLQDGEQIQFRRPGIIRRAPMSSGGTAWC